MKKIIALLLAVIMVMGLATVVSAATNVSKTLKLNKIYTVTGQKDAEGNAVNDNSLLPEGEVLSFTATLTDAPDAVTDAAKASLNLSIENLKTADISGGSAQMTITLPEYTIAGIYSYEIRESVNVKAQAATYSDDVIYAKVYVTYDANNDLVYELVLTEEVDSDDDGFGYVEKVEGEEDKVTYKLDTFKNAYKVGHLSVNKTVSGNLADQDVEFKMTVVFTSELPVKTAITIDDENVDEDLVSTTGIAVGDWSAVENGGYTATATIYVKHGETVNFYNIPAGVKYTVEEDAAHKLDDGETAPDPNSKNTEDYTCDGEVTTATSITANKTDEVKITNNKETPVETGIVMDSVPFVVMAVVAVLGLAAFTAKKRVQE